MDVKEKLIELLDKGPAEYAVGSEGIADHLIANGVTVQEWIPVTERLPEMKHEPYNVLVCHDVKGTMIMDCAWYSHCKQKWCSFNGMNLKVTHWMPLPEPPREG
jgi:hypothetical protein